MGLLYNLGILLYGLGIRIAGLLNKKAKKWIEGRKNYFSKLPQVDPSKKVIWFHCASLGEFDQGLPLMNKIKENEPDCFLLVTFFSPSGMEFYNKRNHKVDLALYLPLDTPSNARKFTEHFKPSQAFFVKYEFWINHIIATKKIGGELYCVSGLFRDSQPFFHWYGSHMKKGLKTFDHFFVQNQTSLDLLATIGITQATVTGDTRIDKVIENKNNVVPDEILSHFKDSHKLLVLGSSWPTGERIILPGIEDSKLKVIIAPHDISEGHIEHIIQQLGGSFQRYTSYDQSVKSNVLILDTIGHLANAYSYADVAYVGGGFSGSLHNILEPAVFGVPTLFGPIHSKYPEADNFIEAGIGFEFTTADEFYQHVGFILGDLPYLKRKTMAYIESEKGAADQIYKMITSN